VENYFNYYTEIEEHFQNRRGTPTLLSPLDWFLIESFQSAGIPLEVILRGIDRAFEKRSKARSKTQKINSLAYCTQAILAEYERHQASLAGSSSQVEVNSSPATSSEADRANLIQLLDKASDLLKQSRDQSPSHPGSSLVEVIDDTISSLKAIKTEISTCQHPDYEHLEMRLSTLEEKVLASLISSLSEDVLMAVRAEVSSEIHRHRRGLRAEQMALLERKMLHKRLFDRFHLPRLSLFYLPLN
jgi:uncharacterized protein YicC (UPF0701 family)